jgi:hypothetical protein
VSTRVLRAEWQPENPDMKLRDEDKDWLRLEIEDAINSLVRPQGWTKFVNWLREWGIVGTVVMAFLALIALCVTLGIFASSGISQESEFRGKTEQRLTDIESNLRGINEKLAIQSVQVHVALPQSEFQATLPELKAAISGAEDAKAQIPLKTVDDLQQKLLATDDGVADYWPTAAELISYRSRLTLGSSTNWRGLPPCSAIWAPKPVPPPNPSNMINMGPITYTQKDCVWVLDNPNPISDTLFIHCLIIYTGGPILVRDVRFQDCFFDFQLQKTPDPRGQHLGKLLLAAKTNNILFPGPHE